MTAIASTPYTAADDETVTRMWTEGSSLGEIGAVLGRTRSSVAGRVRRLSLPKKGASHNKSQASQKAARARWGEPRPPKPAKEKFFSFKKVKPSERKPPMFLRVVSVPDSKPVPLVERTGCCYPTTGQGPHLFCNEPVQSGDYCEFHRSVMYTKRRVA